MKLANEIGRVRNVRRWLPGLSFGSVFVTGPADEVFEFIATTSRIENGRDFIFCVAVDFDRRRKRME